MGWSVGYGDTDMGRGENTGTRIWGEGKTRGHGHGETRRYRDRWTSGVSLIELFGNKNFKFSKTYYIKLSRL